MNVPQWLWQVVIWLDQGLNLFITPFSDEAWADETISSRVWRMRQRKLWCRLARPLIDGFFRVFFFEVGHCKASYESEDERRHLPPEFRIR